MKAGYIPRRSKYGNKKVTVFGITFDSKREAQRYLELVSMERAGKIKNLQTQVPFELIPPIRDNNDKLIQRSCDYVADFVYSTVSDDGTTTRVVEDAKGYRTEVYKIKKKLMLWQYGIRIKEV